MALNAIAYSRLYSLAQEVYPGPTGFETHFYYKAGAPVSGLPEIGLINQFPLLPPDQVNVVDRFNCSVDPQDNSNNCIVVQYYSLDLQTLLWSFNLQLSLLVSSPNYTYPTFLSSRNWVMAISFNSVSGGGAPTNGFEYFSFRYRQIDRRVN